MFCIHCGKELPEDAGFCPGCGKAQSADAATPAPVVVAKPALSRGALVAIIAAVLFLPTLAFLGIIAAVAIPAYSDYTTRARIAEGLYAAAPLKVAYAEYVATNGDVPGDIGALGLVPDIKPPLQQIALDGGLLVLQFDSSLQNDTLALEPWLDDSGNVAWLCGYAGLPDWQDAEDATALTESNAADYTSFRSKLLPAQCR
ncbi:MAG: pilin [Lysobacteraceae bacterium]